MPTFVLENSFQFARVRVIHPQELSNLNLIKTPDFLHISDVYCTAQVQKMTCLPASLKKLIYIIVRLSTTLDTIKCIFHWWNQFPYSSFINCVLWKISKMQCMECPTIHWRALLHPRSPCSDILQGELLIKSLWSQPLFCRVLSHTYPPGKVRMKEKKIYLAS